VSDLGGMSQAELIAAVRKVEDERAESLNLSGRMLATLHDVHRLSWPSIARLTGISQSTAHRRAQPYLTAEDPEGG
jgi:DNA-directed RNA polymerase specialized sigma24 family protein